MKDKIVKIMGLVIMITCFPILILACGVIMYSDMLISYVMYMNGRRPSNDDRQ